MKGFNNIEEKTQTHGSNISGNHTYRNIFQFKPDKLLMIVLKIILKTVNYDNISLIIYKQCIYRMHLHIQISFKQMIEISMPELLIIAVYRVH